MSKRSKWIIVVVSAIIVTVPITIYLVFSLPKLLLQRQLTDAADSLGTAVYSHYQAAQSCPTYGNGVGPAVVCFPNAFVNNQYSSLKSSQQLQSEGWTSYTLPNDSSVVAASASNELVRYFHYKKSGFCASIHEYKAESEELRGRFIASVERCDN